MPNVRDDGQRPSLRARDSGNYAGDLPLKKTEIFLQTGLDRFLLICPSGKSPVRVPLHDALDLEQPRMLLAKFA
jgi:hypothetical protein